MVDQYLTIPNLEKHQHYKDRRPPWIKLHASLLQDYEFSRLSDAEKYQIIALWLLASQVNNKLPLDERWLCNKIQAKSINLNKFNKLQLIKIMDISPLAECKQSALVETETETETETEKGGFKPPNISQLKTYITAKNYSHVNPVTFISHYESNGWKVGKNKMKSWESAVNGWEARSKSEARDKLPEDNYMLGAI